MLAQKMHLKKTAILTLLLMLFSVGTLYSGWTYIGSETEGKTKYDYYVDSEVRRDRGIPNYNDQYRQVWVKRIVTEKVGLFGKQEVSEHVIYCSFAVSTTAYYRYILNQWLGPYYSRGDSCWGKIRRYVM